MEKLDSLMRVKADIEVDLRQSQDKLSKALREKALLKSKVEILEALEKKVTEEEAEKRRPLEKKLKKMKSKSRGMNQTLIQVKKDKSQAEKDLAAAQESGQQLEKEHDKVVHLLENAKSKVNTIITQQ